MPEIPETVEDLTRIVAADLTQPLSIAGGKTSLDYGYPLAGDALEIQTTNLNQLLDYPARDMTVTVEAGMTVANLQQILAGENQQLPVDVPDVEAATIGGALATNISGPRRFGYGTFRDYLIGVSAVNAEGKLFSAGGRVVKNVAGYDLCKMLVGSLGTLAVITQATFKLKPLAHSRCGIWATFETFEDLDLVLEYLLTSQTRPVLLDVLNTSAAASVCKLSGVDLPQTSPVLVVMYEGTEPELDWQLETVKTELAPFQPTALETVEQQCNELLHGLTAFPVQQGSPLSFKANLLPSGTMEFCDQAINYGIDTVCHAGNGVVYGHFPDSLNTLETAGPVLTKLRRFTREHSGNLVVLDCSEAWKQTLPLFGDPTPAWELMRKLKNQLDPQQRWNPGRMFPMVTAEK